MASPGSPTRARPLQPSGRHAATTAAAVAHAALFVVSLVVAGVAAEGAVPQPTSPTPSLLAYARANADVVGVVSLLQFLSAVALLVLAALLGSDLRRRTAAHGSADPWASLVTVAGAAAAVLLALSALVSWVLVNPEAATDPSVLRTSVVVSFVLGGPGPAVLLGVLFLGVAVAGRAVGLPTWLTVTGGVLATTGLLSASVLVAYSAAPLIPVTRFPGFAWLIAVALALAPRADPGHRSG